jgi:hypothetical protein
MTKPNAELVLLYEFGAEISSFENRIFKAKVNEKSLVKRVNQGQVFTACSYLGGPIVRSQIVRGLLELLMRPSYDRVSTAVTA